MNWDRARVGLRIVTTSFTVVVVGLVCQANSQEFEIEAQIVPVGQGELAGGLFSLTGGLIHEETIEELSGGGFSMSGGFESLGQSGQTREGPVLSAVLAAGRLEIRWPAFGADGYELEETSQLGAGAVWSVVQTIPVIVDGRRVVTLTAPQVRRFFRLRGD